MSCLSFLFDSYIPDQVAYKMAIRKCQYVQLLLLLWLSHFSCVRLCAAPQMAAHQAPRSLGFSRQEYWSVLPFPSPMCESEVTQSCPTPSNPMDCSLPGYSIHGIFQARVLEWVAIAFSICTAHPLKKKPAQESLPALANGLNKCTAWQTLWSDPYPDPQKSMGNLDFHIYQAVKILSKPQFSCCWGGVFKGRVGSRTLIFTEH